MSDQKLVMVVDDDADLRESLCALLESEGYQAIGKPDGASALEELRSDAPKPEVVLLDLMMPGMSGWEFREQQLQQSDLAAIPVILMTASRNLRNIQVNEVILKPFRLDALLAVIARVC